jgi:hypothetical protein
MSCFGPLRNTGHALDFPEGRPLAGHKKSHVNRAWEHLTRLLAETTLEDIGPDRITQAALQR